MNDHPVVLKQWIEALAVTKRGNADQVVLDGSPRKSQVFRKFTNEHEGAGSDFGSEDVDAQDHARKQQLGEADDRHGTVFPRSGSADQEPAQDHVPKHPDDEAALLAFPQCAEHVFQRKVARRVAPHVVKLKPVAENGGHQNT